VRIPDFCFGKDGMKVYLEVVDFWTPEYLERKVSKLNSIAPRYRHGLQKAMALKAKRIGE